MRQDRRPYFVKKIYLQFRKWYSINYLRPACNFMGDYPMFFKPWHISISGPNIEIGHCATIIAEPESPVKISVWGRASNQGRVCIGDNVLISPGVRISASDEILIGNGVMMANGVYITDCDWHDLYDRTERAEKHYPVHIGDNAWLGDRATILKGVTVGENSVVAAGAVVTRDVPANVVVAGNPAVVVKQLDPKREIIGRATLFTNPEKLEPYFDSMEREVLADNTLFGWLRTFVKPRNTD